MGFNHADVLAVLAKHGKLRDAAAVRRSHFDRINQYWVTELRRPFASGIEKRRTHDCQAILREQIGMKVLIEFPDGDPRYVFPFYAINFDTGVNHAETNFSILSDSIVYDRVKEVLLAAGIKFFDATGRVTINIDLRVSGAKESMLATVQLICEKLRSIIPDANSQYYYDSQIEKLLRAVRQFIHYNEIGFKYLYPTELPPVTLKDATMTETQVATRQIVNGMYSALVSRENATTILRELLQTGLPPDFSYEGADPGLLENVAARRIKTPEELEHWLALLDLLLLYSADSTVSSTPGRSCIRKLITHCLAFPGALQEEYAIRALTRMAHASSTGERFLVHEDHANTRIGRAIHAMNQYYKQRDHVAPYVASAKFSGSSIYFTMKPNQQAKPNNGKPTVIKVTTRRLNSLTPVEMTTLFSIFKERFGELAKQKGVSLDVYFAETLDEALKQSGSHAMVDLIEVVGENRICGFNMFHTKLMQIEGEPTLAYRILLVAANQETANHSSISQYKGFMSLLQYLRGFVLQEKFPGLRVFTVLEALNARVPAQLFQLGLEYFPLYSCLSEVTLRELKLKLYDGYDVIFERGCLHVDDVLAGGSPASKISSSQQDHLAFGAQRAQVAVVNFHRFFKRTGHATVLAFENSQNNFSQLIRSLSIAMAAKLLESLVAGLATIIQADGSYEPVKIDLR